MYSYNKFLRQLGPNDTNIQIQNNNGLLIWTIEPYSVLNVMVNNNLLKINLKNKVIIIPFSSTNESKLALPLFQEYLDDLKSRTPLLIDKKLENILTNIDSHLIPATGSTYDLGATAGYNWRDLYLSGDTIYLGDSTIKSESNNIIIDNLILGGPTSQGGILLTTDGDSFLVNGNPIDSSKQTIFPYLKLTNDVFNPYIGDEISFRKSDYGNEIDEIDNNVSITRGNRQGIYNIELEAGWDDTDRDGISPKGTLWNLDGWDNLTNLEQRRYYSFYDVYRGEIGNNIINSEPIMKDVSNNKYYKFDFTVWGNSWNGAPVTYTRIQIDQLTGEEIGDPVTFSKNGYDDPTQVNDPIDNNLTISRGNQQGIYNIELEDSWDTDGDGQNSPEGTLWNSDGWGDLTDIKSRTYVNFRESLDYNIGNNILGTELVMYDTINDKYWTFKFTSWTRGNNGGGFSYTRRQINKDIYFIKSDYGDEIDEISEGLHITRGNRGWLYNPLVEEEHDDETPTGSLWNNGGWDNLSDVEQRNYSSLESIWGGNFRDIPGSEMIMLDTTTDIYWLVKFLSWTDGNNGGGFSYLKYQLDLNILGEGITFADGSKLKTSNGLGKIKSTSVGGRRIEEIYGYSEVEFIEIQTIQSANGVAIDNPSAQPWDVYLDRSSNTDIEDIIEFSETLNVDYSWRLTLDGEVVNSTGLFPYYTGNGQNIIIFLGFDESNNYLVLPYSAGSTVFLELIIGGKPVRWFRAEGSNLRGAIIDYHAYVRNLGTIIGTIHISRDSGRYTIAHTESKSGSSNIDQADLWYRNENGNEREIWFRRLDGQNDTLKVQWSAKLFYGNEYWD
jgi:hypothetical protein